MTENKEIPIFVQSVVFPIKKGTILLGVKVNKIGVGARNGYGGNLNDGETIEECALRELKEESSLTGKIENLNLIAVTDCHNTKPDGRQVIYRVHYFILSEPEGIPQETEEMLKPAWFNVNDIPFDDMMLGDRFWLPQALNGEPIYAQVHYGPNQKTLTDEVVVKKLSEAIF